MDNLACLMDDLAFFKEELNRGRYPVHNWHKLFNASKYKIKSSSDYEGISYYKSYEYHPIQKMLDLLSKSKSKLDKWDKEAMEKIINDFETDKPSDILATLGEVNSFLKGVDLTSVDADSTRRFHLDYIGVPLGRYYECSCFNCGVPSGKVAVLNDWGSSSDAFFVFMSEIEAPDYEFKFSLKREFVRQEMSGYSEEFSDEVKKTKKELQSFLKDLHNLEELVKLKAENGESNIPDIHDKVIFKPPHIKWYLWNFDRSKQMKVCDVCFEEWSKDNEGFGRSIYKRVGYENEEVSVDNIEFSLKRL